MTQKQKDKHIADKAALKAAPEYFPVASSLESTGSSPDGLGVWEGGRNEIKGANNWVALKSRATRTADAKHAPGTDYASKINETHQKPLLIEESDNIPCGESNDSI